MIALGLTLVTSVRRRRTDLALLKSLGFTKRQLASAIAWQASVAVGIGCLIGIPLGIALGRFLWDLFVRQIDAVPDPTIPTWSIVLIAVGALILANVVAAIPGRDRGQHADGAAAAERIDPYRLTRRRPRRARAPCPPRASPGRTSASGRARPGSACPPGPAGARSGPSAHSWDDRAGCPATNRSPPR